MKESPCWQQIVLYAACWFRSSVHLAAVHSCNTLLVAGLVHQHSC